MGKFSQFVELFKTNPIVSSNLLTSGLYFYLYNELSTLTIKKTSATTQSVANTAKRVIVIVGVAIANIFAAFRSNENKKLMDTAGLSDRIGSVGNQFALTTLLGAICVLPVLLLTEGSKLGEFMTLFQTSSILKSNLLTSGLYFYLYNELSTLTIKKTSATTQS